MGLFWTNFSLFIVVTVLLVLSIFMVLLFVCVSILCYYYDFVGLKHVLIFFSAWMPPSVFDMIDLFYIVWFGFTVLVGVISCALFFYYVWMNLLSALFFVDAVTHVDIHTTESCCCPEFETNCYLI